MSMFVSKSFHDDAIEMAGEKIEKRVFPVQQEWMMSLPMQQQSVLLLSCRGPDGLEKYHPVKPMIRNYRAFILNAAKYGRPLSIYDRGDTFMNLIGWFDVLETRGYPLLERHYNGPQGYEWSDNKANFFDYIDQYVNHWVLHFMHGVEILGYKYPNPQARARWNEFYLEIVDAFHLLPEPEYKMDERLGDWNKKHYDNSYNG